ncbi:MAG: outer membrane protein assembly factor BamD [Bryobacterales bacterium]|nr:outer membrane protein assembly factor BamD [Bryobacterales bacterium]
MARYFLMVIMMAGLVTSCGFRRKKYDDPITKDTKQPDKVLFDRAIDDIEHGRYEVARITLNTLINTYDQSEFLAKAKLAVADSWYREGGAASLAQAEAEYKDFILFYPTMEEAAESQQKICMIHYKQMDKVDRDQSQAIRAEDECRQLVVQFPNSKYVDETKQLLRNIQEAIAEGEYAVGYFYFKRGDNSAAANRLSHVVEQYPLYSKADLALWQMGQAYGRLGNRFRKQEGDAYTQIVRDYPLSPYADDATRRLKELEMPVPQPDKTAVARMQFEKEHREKPGFVSRETLFLKRGPDMSTAAHSGDPAMTTLRPSVPPLVPQAPGAGSTFNGDVTATTVGNSTALDTKPDARANPPAEGGAAASSPAAATTTPAAATDSSQQSTSQAAAGQNAAADQNGKKKKKSKKQKQQQPAAQPAAAQPDAAQPASPQPVTAQPGAAQPIPTSPPSN